MPRPFRRMKPVLGMLHIKTSVNGGITIISDTKFFQDVSCLEHFATKLQPSLVCLRLLRETFCGTPYLWHPSVLTAVTNFELLKKSNDLRIEQLICDFKASKLNLNVSPKRICEHQI